MHPQILLFEHLLLLCPERLNTQSAARFLGEKQQSRPDAPCLTVQRLLLQIHSAARSLEWAFSKTCTIKILIPKLLTCSVSLVSGLGRDQ